jgi:hypothetical protein
VVVLFVGLTVPPATTGTIDVVADVNALPHAEPFTMQPRTAYPILPRHRSAPVSAADHLAREAQVAAPRMELSPWEAAATTVACTLAVLSVVLLGFLTAVGG